MMKIFTHEANKIIESLKIYPWAIGLLIFSFASLPGKAQTTTVTTIDFSDPARVVAGASLGAASVRNGMGEIVGTNGNPSGYRAYFEIANQITLEPGFDYQITVKARATGQVANLKINKATTPGGTPAGTNLWTGTMPVSGSMQTFTTTTSVTTAETRYIGFYLESTGANGLSAYIDDIVITKTCHPLPITITSSGATTFCKGGSVGLTASGAESFFWSPSTGLSATSEASVTASPPTTTTYTVTGTNSNGCSSTAQVTITVNDLPNVTLAAFEEVCVDASAFTLTGGSPAGGTYSGTGVNSSTGMFDPAVAGEGSHTITYSYTDGNNCTSSATRELRVNPVPTVSLAAFTDVCVDADAFTLSGGTPTGGTYGGTGVTNGVFDPSAAGEGTHTITYTYTDANGCDNFATSEITVDPLPTVSASTTDGEICEGESTTLLASGASTYTWSPATGLSATTGASVIANPTATTTYTVIGTDGNGCENSAQITVTVNNVPVARIQEAGPVSICAGESTVLHAQTGTGYSYQWRKNGVEISGATGSSFTVTEAGEYSLKVTGANSCVSFSEDVSPPTEVVVEPLPSAPVNIVPGSHCGAGTVTLSAQPGSGGDVVRWYANASGGSLLSEGNSFTTPSLSTSTTYYIATYNSTTGCETATRTAVVATIYTVPAMPNAEDGRRCGPGAVSLTASGAPAGGSYRWYTAAGTPIAGETSATYTTPSLTTNTTYLVSVVSSDNCESEKRTVQAIINNVPDAPTARNGEHCGPGAVTIGAEGGTTGGYRWYTADDDNALIAGETSATYTTPPLSATTTYYVSVVNTDNCESARTAVQAIINDVPGAPTANNEDRCGPGAVEFTATGAAEGESYRWYTAAGTPIAGETSATYTTPSLSATTTFYVSVLSAADCESSRTAIQAIVYDIPAMPNAEDGRRCGPGAVSLTASGAPAGGGYRWYTAAGTPIAGETSATYTTPSLTTNTTYLVSVVSSDNCESEKRAVQAIINNVPDAPTVADQTFCSGDNPTVASLPQGGGSYKWYSSLEATSALPSTEILNSDTYYVSQTSTDNCESARSAVSVTLDPVSDGGSATATDATVCSGEATSVNLTGYTGTILRWEKSTDYNSSTGAGTWTSLANTTTSLSTDNLTATTTYRAVVKSGLCPNAFSAVATVTVNSLPTASAGADKTICSGLSTTIGSTAVSGLTYSWSPTTGLSDPTAANPTVTLTNSSASAITQTYTVTVSNTSTGCSNTDEVNVIVNPLPAEPAITNIKSQYYTADPDVTFSGNPAGGTFTLDGTTTLTNGKFNPCNVAPGTHTIRYTYTDTNGCSNFKDYTVNVKQSTYTVIITANPFPICRGQHTTYTAKVYRDVERIVYPYLENPDDIVPGSTNTTYNPEYDQFLHLYPDWKPIHKLYPVRFFQPQVIGGTLMPASDFSYQWTKNEKVNLSKDSYIFEQAGLSSTDYYKVYVTVKNNPACIVAISNKLTNPLFISEPDGYQISMAAAPSNICRGDNSTVFTANLGDGFDWSTANLQLKWFLKRGGNVYAIKTATGTSDLQLSASEISAALTALSVSPAELLDGDEIYTEFTTDIEAMLPADSKCKQAQTSQNPIKMVVNDLSATANQKNPIICLDGSETFTVNTTATGSNTVTYEWLIDGVVHTTTNNPSLSLSTPLTSETGEYVVSVRVSNSCKTIPLDLGTLTVRDLTQFSLAGDKSYCELTPESYPITLNGSQAGASYTLMYTTEGGTPQPVETITSTAGGAITFSEQSAPGTYTVQADFADAAPSCPKAMSGNFTISTTEALSPTGEIEVWWVEGGEQWEIFASTNHEALGVGEVTYEWDSLNSAGEWVPFTTTYYPDSTILVPPNSTIQVRISGPEGSCVRELVMESINSVPQPVELIYLKAKQQGEDVLLQWATATEKYNTGFEVQVSTDGQQYRNLGFVETKDGNSLEIQEYTYVDKEPAKQGIRYYRLQQLDVDGTSAFFGPIVVELKNVESIAFFPNPFQGKLKVSIEAIREGEAIISVTSPMGRSVLKHRLSLKKGHNTGEILLEPNLPAGIYLISTQIGGKIKYFKLLKQ